MLSGLALIAFLASLPVCCDCSDPYPFSRSFTWHGREYEARFIENGIAERAWSEDLVLRWRPNGDTKWQIAAKVEGVRPENEAKLRDRNGRDIDAVVVSAPGGSAQFISVVEIKKDPPAFRILLDRALDKGGFEYRYDKEGNLIGFKFTYCAWHVSPVELTGGHVFTAVNVGWLPRERRFRTGPVYVDDDAERAASLLDVLNAIGSSQLLDMQEIRDERHRISAYVYRPSGLLWRKTPPELRSAKRIKAVIDYGQDPDARPRITELRALD